MIAYMLIDANNTAPLDSPTTVRDRHSLPEPSDEAKWLPAGREVRPNNRFAVRQTQLADVYSLLLQVPPIYDIAIEKVNRTLYNDPLALSEQLLRANGNLEPLVQR
jgi:hypothetical protein